MTIVYRSRSGSNHQLQTKPTADAAWQSRGHPFRRAINVVALRAAVDDIADRAEELMALTGDAAYPGLVDDLTTLGEELTGLGWDLAHAAPALDILTGIGFRLLKRARGLSESSGLPAPEVRDFLPVPRVSKTNLGRRFAVIADD